MIEIIFFGILIGGIVSYIIYNCNQRQNKVMNFFGKKLKKRLNSDYDNI